MTRLDHSPEEVTRTRLETGPNISPMDGRDALPDGDGSYITGPELPPRFARFISRLREQGFPNMRDYPGLEAQPFHDPQRFPLIRDLERHADAIGHEFRRLLESDFQDEKENIPRSGRWRVAFLYDKHGRRSDRIASLCPVTTRVVEGHRTMRGLGGVIYFSRLEPRTEVGSHRGSINMRLRCHLAIDVPPACGLIVDGREAKWEEGRCLVFEDSFPHQVWNRSSEYRNVLVVDFWHPDLSDDEVALIDGLFRYGHSASLASADSLRMT